jgi:hypothetical protein
VSRISDSLLSMDAVQKRNRNSSSADAYTRARYTSSVTLRALSTFSEISVISATSARISLAARA